MFSLLSPMSRCKSVLLYTYYHYKHDVFSAFNEAIFWWFKTDLQLLISPTVFNCLFVCVVYSPHYQTRR